MVVEDFCAVCLSIFRFDPDVVAAVWVNHNGIPAGLARGGRLRLPACRGCLSRAPAKAITSGPIRVPEQRVLS